MLSSGNPPDSPDYEIRRYSFKNALAGTPGAGGSMKEWKDRVKEK
jgi:hypothetical protein